MQSKLFTWFSSSSDVESAHIVHNNNRAYWLQMLLVVVVSCAAFSALHWRGIPLSPDSWAYWQAAVSIANGSGYKFFSGDPVTAWPPLYSGYLSLWVRVLGPTGVALVVANALLISLQSLVWFLAIRSVWIGKRLKDRPAAHFTVALYIALYVPLTLQAAHAANLGFLCTALMMLAVWAASQSHSDMRWWACVTAAIAAGTLALVTHNANLAFVAGCPMALLLLRRSLLRDAAGAAALVVFPTLIWSAVRWQLSQSDSHPVGLSVATFGLTQYLGQTVNVVGNLIVPNILGAATLVGLLIFTWCGWIVLSTLRSGIADGEKFVAGIVLFTCLALVALFSLSSVTDPIGSRFVGWVPVLIVPMILFRAAHHRFWIFLVVASIVFAPNIHRLAIFSKIHAEQNPNAETGPLFPLGARISPNYMSGPPMQTDQGLLIAPPR